MSSKPFLLLCLLGLPIWAQNADTAAMEAQAAELKALVQKSPRLPHQKSVFSIQAPAAGWEIGYPSSVAMANDGTVYVLQRGEKADPVLALNRDGKILRS